MDWVHCNQCGVKPPRAKIFLTSCGHLLCESCVKKSSSENHSKCFVCEKNFQATEVNSKMRPDLMVLFQDPRDYAASLMKELRAVITFQEKQRAVSSKIMQGMSNAENEKAASLQEHQQKTLKEMESAKADYNEAYANLKAAKDKKRELMAQIEQLRQKRAALEARAALKQNTIAARKSRTEPPHRKISKVNPPPKDGYHRLLQNQRDSNVDILFETLSNTLEESSPLVVTSTPIGNIEASRREFMARMFATGNMTPSPINPK